MIQQSVIPGLRYVDAPGAIAFLCAAFGFERHVVYTDEADPTLVHHAQLHLGTCMVMLGSARGGPDADKYRWRTPAEAGGVTMSVYCVIDDVDAHCAVAMAAGAEIITPAQDNEGYPGRGYNARDPEGNVWSFGSYDPWAGGA